MGKESNVVFVVNVAVPGNEGVYKDFMKNAKELMKNKIEKMILTESIPITEVGIILMGFKDPDNDQDGLGILNYHDMHTVSWELFGTIEEIESNEGIYTKWMGGLKGALRLIEDAQLGPEKCKVFLISNFTEDSSLTFKNFESFAEKFVDQGIELVCCGTKCLRDVAPEDLNANEKKMLDFCRLVGGWYGTFDYLLSKTRFYVPERQKFSSWSVNLELCTIKIPVRVAVRVGKQGAKKSWKLVSVATADGEPTDPPVPVVKEKQLVDRHKSVHEKEDTIKGYMCGKKFIPVTEADEEGMQLPIEQRSLQLYGVAKAETVSFTYRSADTTWILLPQEGLEDRLFHLVKAMKNLNLVGFARKVSMVNSRNPVMCVLTPVMDDPELPWCLVMHQLIFAEEEAMISAEPLDSVMKELSGEERDAINSLVDSMVVEKNGDDSKIEYIPNPTLQHVYNCSAFRALHPDEPLPPPRDYIMALLEPPESVDMAEVKSCVERVKELFDLKTEEVVQVVKKDEFIDMEHDGVENEIAGSLKKGNSMPDDDDVHKKEEDAEERECVDLDDVLDI